LLEVEFAAALGDERHEVEDTPAADDLAVAADPDLPLKAFGAADEHIGRPEAEAEGVCVTDPPEDRAFDMATHGATAPRDLGAVTSIWLATARTPAMSATHAWAICLR